MGLCMGVWLGLHVGGCMRSCLFLRAGMRLCVGMCEDVGATRRHTHTNPSQTSHPWIHTHTQTRTHAHKPIHTHTHTHTHINTPTMIPPHIPNHDTSTMQVCVRMCGWAVCVGVGVGGVAGRLHSTNGMWVCVWGGGVHVRLSVCFRVWACACVCGGVRM